MVNPRIDLDPAIRAALHSAEEGDFAEQAARLLAVLGYSSERILPGQSGDVGEFLEQFPPTNSDTKSEQDFREATASINILFQVTNEEIQEGSGTPRLFRDDTFDKGNVKSFLFTAVELRGEGYARGRYASFTREINKRFPQIPSVVLFRTTSGRITLAFVHVRPNKRNPKRNVIGSVSLIREIYPKRLHRAHVDILAELSLGKRLQWMSTRGREQNFDGLLDAWRDALDTEELNRRFFNDLFGWFNRAKEEARFPSGVRRAQPAQRHLIRLITRMLFIWFIKEKGLVAEELFVENQVAALLKGYDPDNGDSYYRAVLQNLFFATLNTPIQERGFRKPGEEGYNSQHRVFSRYRYEKEMEDTNGLRSLFDKTPFINGGLFDCLDSLDARGPGEYRIDYFSDNVVDPKRKGKEFRAFSVPNRLFFDEGGLITLFNHYKFTVEENTPAEQEVALDPELLGKVFEKLLEDYKRENGRNERKQTGTYYTPRDIVDYMVDEALVAALRQKAMPPETDTSWWDGILHYLLDYNDAGELFDDEQKARVVRAISELHVLDPAVGSGAFPWPCSTS